MDKKICLDILGQKRIKILPLLKLFKEDFYIAGGTGLALLLGHRNSIDFDFFCTGSFSTAELFKKIEQIFVYGNIYKLRKKRILLL